MESKDHKTGKNRNFSFVSHATSVLIFYSLFLLQVRSRIFNLKDKKNPALRENVLFGVIEPEKFATMTSEEMASDEVRILLMLALPSISDLEKF